MKIRLNQRGVGNILLLCMIILFILHLLVLTGVIPPSIIWDTTITDTESIVISESIALFLILLFILGIVLKLNYIPFKALQKNADTLLWIMILYLLLNIIGNFMSDDGLKKLIYSPITLIVALLTLRLIFSSPLSQHQRKKRQKK